MPEQIITNSDPYKKSHRPEARNTARRAYKNNSKLSAAETGKAIGRARRTVDDYTSDLRATVQMGMDINVFPMNRLGIPQDRVAKKLDLARPSFHYHLPKMATLPFSANRDLSQGFTAPMSAQRFNPGVVCAMQKKRILGVTGRYVVILK